MAKWIGVIMIVSATSLLGAEAAARVKDEYLQIQYVQKILWMMKSRISYSRADLEEVFRQISREIREPYKSWLLKIAGEMKKNEGKMISQIWREQTAEMLKASGLPKPILGKLQQAGVCLGSADIEFQIKNLELYIEELRQSMNELRPLIREKVRVYHWLGVAGGVFISVLLL